MIPTNLLLYLGFALALGFFLGKATHWFKITAIVGYIIAGIILGPMMNFVMEDALSTGAMTIIVDLTLGLVGFIIGLGFTKGFLRRYGKMVIGIAIFQSTITFIIVFFGVYILTKDTSLALILGVIGLATAPAGTVAAIHLSRGRGQLSRVTIAVVGIDDGIGIIYFVIVLSFVKFLVGDELPIHELISISLIEIGGAISIGGIFGLLLGYIGKIVKHREDVFIIVLSFLFICTGICEIINSSSILACMVFGIIFINYEPRIGRTTQSDIENIIPPIFVVFFAIAGLELGLQIGSLFEFGLITTLAIIIVYIIYRILGKLAGAMVAGKLVKAPTNITKYLGFALLSQAGVAIGLAILTNNELGQNSNAAYLGALVITIITITTIFFEIIGPIGVRYALTKAGEAHDFG